MNNNDTLTAQSALECDSLGGSALIRMQEKASERRKTNQMMENLTEAAQCSQYDPSEGPCGSFKGDINNRTKPPTRPHQQLKQPHVGLGEGFHDFGTLLELNMGSYHPAPVM